MKIDEYRDLIVECKRSLESSERLFKDVFVSSVITSNGIVALSQDNLERNKKMRYMAVALICIEWESLRSQIHHSDQSKHHKFCIKVYKGDNAWGTTKSLRELGILRDCIMHHGGEIFRYTEWMKRKRGVIVVIDKKYEDPKTKKLSFTDEHLFYFFKLIKEDSLDHIFTRIENHIEKNNPPVSILKRLRLF
ncbi:MAG: hypothetical protein WCQ32_02480 [bacterium]